MRIEEGEFKHTQEIHNACIATLLLVDADKNWQLFSLRRDPIRATLPLTVALLRLAEQKLLSCIAVMPL